MQHLRWNICRDAMIADKLCILPCPANFVKQILNRRESRNITKLINCFICLYLFGCSCRVIHHIADFPHSLPQHHGKLLRARIKANIPGEHYRNRLSDMILNKFCNFFCLIRIIKCLLRVASIFFTETLPDRKHAGSTDTYGRLR